MLIGTLKRAARALGAYGREELDTTPKEVPLGFKRPESLEEQIKRLIQQPTFGRVVSGDAEAETFDEANDFDIEDDPADPASEHEEFYDPVLQRTMTPAEVLEPKRQAELSKRTYAKRPDKKEEKAAPEAPPEHSTKD